MATVSVLSSISVSALGFPAEETISAAALQWLLAGLVRPAEPEPFGLTELLAGNQLA